MRNLVTKGVPTEAGIYKVPCSGCELIYIGESDNISRRMQQHKNDIRNCNLNNPIMKHIVNTEHPITVNNFSIVNKRSKFKTA